MDAKTVAAYRVPWWALGVSPALTALTQLTNYALASQACGSTGRAFMIGVAVVSLLITGAMWWSAWRHTRGDDALHTEIQTSESVVAFTWHLALLVNTFFGLVMIAFTVPPLFLHGCR